MFLAIALSLTEQHLIDNEKRNKEEEVYKFTNWEWQIKLTYICMKSLTNVWIVVENWHSMARAILIYMLYAKDVALVSIMTKSLVTNTTYQGSRFRYCLDIMVTWTSKRKAKKDRSTEPAQMKGLNPTEPDKNISKTEEIT